MLYIPSITWISRFFVRLICVKCATMCINVQQCACMCLRVNCMQKPVSCFKPMALLYCFPKGRYESNYEVSPASSCWFLSHILEFSSFKIGDWNIAQLIQIHIISSPKRRKNLNQHETSNINPKIPKCIIFFLGGPLRATKNSKRLARSSSPELRPLDDPITAQEVGDEV